MAGEWSPTCGIPTGLVAPVRIDPAGTTGPTKHESSGPLWRRTSPGLFVPAWADGRRVEQRILEQSSRIGQYGALTAWASLRWRGSAYFDGEGREQQALPVPLAVGKACVRPDPSVLVIRRQTPLVEWDVVRGVPCTIATRALFDEVIRLDAVRASVVAIDMAVAAGLTSVAEFRAFLRHIGPRNGIVLAREAALLAIDTSWSPQESWMRLCWMLDADLPEPMCNVPVFDLAGNLLGIPDLFDEEAGVVGEYQGEVHRTPERHRADVLRAERFREHGLVYFEVVAGQLADVQTATRMRHARARAGFLAPEKRQWTLKQPAWWRQGHQTARAS